MTSTGVDVTELQPHRMRQEVFPWLLVSGRDVRNWNHFLFKCSIVSASTPPKPGAFFFFFGALSII